MTDLLRPGELRGIASWLVSNTALTFDQITDFLRIPALDVKAIADDVFSPRPLPIDPIQAGWMSRDDIEQAEQSPSIRLARPWSWSSEGLQPIFSQSCRDAPVESVSLSRVAYMFYGRNAWHSTWIQRYYTRSSIGLTVGSVQGVCERNRVQGSVFNVEELPCLVLRCEDQTLYAVEINNGAWLERAADVFDGPLFTKRILARFEEIPANQVIWLALPEKVSPKPVSFTRTFRRMSSFPQGTGRALGWKQVSRPNEPRPEPWDELVERVRKSLPLTQAITRAASFIGPDAAARPSALDINRRADGFLMRWQGTEFSFDATGSPAALEPEGAV